ncbi:hypothetical protein [uncultured Arcticibacterium sp.]|uniref:hypothetical protein n=1 Tax=uncultured Arcticibacterium sp. TaxID=2173042 RepID=UPI0030F9B02D
MKKVIIAFLSVSFLMTSCKKDEEVDVEQKARIELLTNNSSKSWKVKDGIAKQNGLEVNLLASQSPCVTDNIITLVSDFTYDFLEGDIKCEPSDPDLILSANWSLSQDESIITIDKFIFLGRTVDNPAFALSEVTETTFSGTTNLTFEGETFDVDVTFEVVN